MAYCTTDNVRALCGLTTTDISDVDLTTLIGMATYQVNAEINVRVVREFVWFLDNTRKNMIDGSNKDYYVRNWKDYFLADLNNDGSVTTSDITAYSVDGYGTETVLAITSIDDDDGKITFTSAPPQGTRLYLTYSYAPVREGTPDSLLSLATAYLASAYAFSRINAKKLGNYSIGKLRISKQSDGFMEFYNKYKAIINQLKRRPISKVRSEEVDKVVML